MSMSTAELESFLAQTFPTPLGVIATLRRDGSPHIVPVWFRWDAGAVTIWTTETRAWVQNLLRDPRVGGDPVRRPPGGSSPASLGGAPPGGERGGGRDPGATEGAAPRAEEIGAPPRRYIAPGDVKGYIARWPDLRTIVTITPAHI